VGNLLKAAPTDISILLELEKSCFSDAWSEKSLKEALDDEKYLILLCRDSDDVPLGYLIGWNVGDEAELARIAVVPQARGRGWSKVILDHALKVWGDRGVRQVFLEVRSSNVVARGLYFSRGFELIATRKGYYEDGEDALVMRLELSAPSAD
jgi:ribosomal-protein-alanine N-acetyltransferase